jgi:hypothetical protein
MRPMTSVSNVAPDKKAGMTFGDLRTFVQDCMTRDMPDNARIQVDVGWSQQIQKITASEKEER